MFAVKYRLFLLGLLCAGCATSVAAEVAVQLSAGSSWLFFSGLATEDDISHREIHDNQFNFNSGVQIFFAPVARHQFSVGVNYLRARPVAKIFLSAHTYMEIPDYKYKIEALPVSLNYEFLLNQNRMTPFIGAGMAYIFTRAEVEPQYTIRERVKYKFEGHVYAGSGCAGIYFNLSPHWRLSSRLAYQLSSSMTLSGMGELELSGLSLSLGITGVL